MSIIIKGIDLPKDDNYIVLEIEKNGTVEAYSSTFGEVDGDPIAIQIDRPHGRLIDKDFLMNWLEITEECKDCKSNYYGFCSKGTYFVDACEAIITEAPTILEAEE